MEPKTIVRPTRHATDTQPELEVSLLLRPVADNDQIVAMFRKYKQLKSSLLDEADYMIISERKFIKKSGWRKLSSAFGISDELMKEERRAGDNSFSFEVTVKASAQNGRFAYGVGSCTSNEREFTHPEHDVRATAHTRAKNRAVSDLVGFGEVSAEEMVGDTKAVVEDAPAQGLLGDSRQDPKGGDPITQRQEKLLTKLILEKAPEEEHAEFFEAMKTMSKQDASVLISGFHDGGFW